VKPTSLPPAGQANTDRPTTSVRHESEVSLAEFLAHKATISTGRGLALDPLGGDLAQALIKAGWQPPNLRKRAGQASGKARAGGKILRQIFIEFVMSDLPATFRNSPRSVETVARVQDGLQRIAGELPTIGKSLIASDDTVQRDIYQLGYRGRKGRVTK
jgi:hypothetical protein